MKNRSARKYADPETPANEEYYAWQEYFKAFSSEYTNSPEKGMWSNDEYYACPKKGEQ